jgi:hypothetical protein
MRSIDMEQNKVTIEVVEEQIDSLIVNHLKEEMITILSLMRTDLSRPEFLLDDVISMARDLAGVNDTLARYTVCSDFTEIMREIEEELFRAFK